MDLGVEVVVVRIYLGDPLLPFIENAILSHRSPPHPFVFRFESYLGAGSRPGGFARTDVLDGDNTSRWSATSFRGTCGPPGGYIRGTAFGLDSHDANLSRHLDTDCWPDQFLHRRIELGGFIDERFVSGLFEPHQFF